MKRAVLVFNSEPILGNLIPSQIRLDGNLKHYPRALEPEITRLNLPWQVALDQSVGDVSAWLVEGNQLLSYAPGLEHQLDHKKFAHAQLFF